MNGLETVYREGRLLRRRWESTDAQGRELLCVLTALAGSGVRPHTCPASVAPEWVAYLLPWLDDAPSAEEWPRIIERLIPLALRLPELSDRCKWLVHEACVREAMRHTDHPEELSVRERVAQLCLRRADGADVLVDLADVAETADSVTWATQSAALAAHSSTWAALAAKWAEPATWAAVAAATRAAGATWAAAGAAASDRLAHRILDLWEQDLAAPEA